MMMTQHFNSSIFAVSVDTHCFQILLCNSGSFFWHELTADSANKLFFVPVVTQNFDQSRLARYQYVFVVANMVSIV